VCDEAAVELLRRQHGLIDYIALIGPAAKVLSHASHIRILFSKSRAGTSAAALRSPKYCRAPALSFV